MRAYHLYSVAREPMEDLEEEKGDEEHDEGALKLLAEDGEGEEGLGDGEPTSLLQTLGIGGTRSAWLGGGGRRWGEGRTSTSINLSSPKKTACMSLPRRTVW